jgi:hypothetical protein
MSRRCIAKCRHSALDLIGSNGFTAARNGWGWRFRCLSILLAIAAATSPAMAQAPVAQGCGIAAVGGPGASIVQATGDSLQRKRWQPQGGVIQFTLRSFARIPDDASFFVCFRWKTTPENTEMFDQLRPDRLDRNNDGTT